mgnify:CR=1 FL=1
MSDIMDVVDTKGIERTDIKMKIEEVSEAPTPKPKKERSQAQKEAFEKARKKRAENLAQKKLEEEAMAEVIAEEGEVAVANGTSPSANPIEAPKKKRGRPKKSKIVNKEPPVEQFIEPQQVNPRMLNRYATQQEPLQHFNPYHYYYGEQEKQLNNFNHYPQEPESQLNQAVQFAQQDDLLYRDDESESEEEYELPPDPRLKFRMAG